jgi:hypothetical protein
MTSSVKWDQDVLNRKPIGDFLYNLLVQKYSDYHSQPEAGALCMALDADWGAGKSFFVDRWSQDISVANHPVIHFDAWANDLADDPLLGFMAKLQADLKPWLGRLPLSSRVKRAAEKKLNTVIKNAGRAVLPALAVLGKAVVKKVSAVDVDELTEAVSEAISDPESAIGETAKVAGEALEKFFGEALRSHVKKQEAISALKESLEDLLGYLAEQEQIKLPMFVFIDELDRCRPDYAVRLLEGVKHLFDAQGLCFVFSTNLAQLAACVRSVYGEGFDSPRYLKRFFSFEYLLPEPDNLAYANLLSSSSVFERKNLKVISGLPLVEGMPAPPRQLIAENFATIANLFHMDLRSQKQVFRQCEAVAASLPDGKPCYCFYLFFLAAILHYSVTEFDKISGAEKPIAFSAPLTMEDIAIPYTVYDEGREVRTSQSAIKLFWRLHQTGKTTLAVLAKGEIPNTRNYPDSALHPIYAEANRSDLKRGDLPSLAVYPGLIRSAGQLR